MPLLGCGVPFHDYGRYDALGLADLVRRGETSPIELLEAALARMDAVNPAINAVIHRMEGAARLTIAAGLPDGPFRGVPFLLKDLVQACAGEPLRSGSRLLRDFVASHDEELVRRFRSAGFVIFGKTNTPEFGMANVTEPELFGPTRNPWNLERTPGGSSGGSAAAVAAGIVPAASANDGGGSIRTPASNCGLVGLKPSRGRNPSGPQAPELWWGFVAEHAVTRSVRDSAALLDATYGDYPGQLTRLPPPVRPFLEETVRDPGRLRVAWSLDRGLGTVLHPENRAAMDRATAALAGAGHALEEVTLPVTADEFIRHYATLVAAEATATIRLAERLVGRRATAADLELPTLGARAAGCRLVRRRHGRGTVLDADLHTPVAHLGITIRRLLTPTVGVPPLPIGAYRLSDGVATGDKSPARTARPGCLLTRRRENNRGIPADVRRSSLHHGGQRHGTAFDLAAAALVADGLPMGLLFTSRPGDEATLFRLAGQLEQGCHGQIDVRLTRRLERPCDTIPAKVGSQGRRDGRQPQFRDFVLEQLARLGHVSAGGCSAVQGCTVTAIFRARRR